MSVCLQSVKTFYTGYNLDKNWLFNDTSQNFITQVNNDMLFAF